MHPIGIEVTGNYTNQIYLNALRLKSPCCCNIASFERYGSAFHMCVVYIAVKFVFIDFVLNWLDTNSFPLIYNRVIQTMIMCYVYTYGLSYIIYVYVYVYTDGSMSR